MPDTHRLERRAELLARRMRDAADSFAGQLGLGDRPPFTTAMTKNESLAWWREHLYDEYGKAALARMQPIQIIQLHADLAKEMNPEPAEEVG